MRGYPDHRVVVYEDLCADPVERFRELYDYASLDWSGEVEAQIMARSSAQGACVTKQFGVHRKSEEMAGKWRGEVPPEGLELLRDAYLSFDPPFYAGAETWL